MPGIKKVIQSMTQQADRDKVIQLSGYSQYLVSFLSATGY
jgi:hypothetical protein